ncbi:MAG TPA: sigma-54 dependent transcriptional regulator [Candidatus Wallbacteria bacterium]|nr:sigma-54 dependent transcriptional regulator [Candidatus Wallbacteria bacterium]
MKKICLSWIGTHDLNSIAHDTKYGDGSGPIIALLESPHADDFDELHLLYNFGQPLEKHKDEYRRQISKKYAKNKTVVFHEHELNPTDYNRIYEITTGIMKSLQKKYSNKKIKWHFHTSPGTGQMNAIWVLLSKTAYPATLYQSHYEIGSKKQIVKTIDLEFNIDAEYIPEVTARAREKILKNIHSEKQYGEIIYRSDIMESLLYKTRKLAAHNVSVLITGETGTGKELLAKAIHAASLRKGKKMLTLNCAAIQETTANATLFGWSKGAWTGACGEGSGYFLECSGGTIFLDEIGELSLETQTKLLRAIQEGEVQRVGDGRVSKVDVRIIAATHKNLLELVKSGKFREDLYYRLNVFAIELPPLRKRGDDITLLAEKFLKAINDKNDEIPGYVIKKLSASARQLLVNYPWPGNVRELYNTLQRVCLWADSSIITAEELKNYFTHGAQTEAAGPDHDFLFPVDLDAITVGLRKKYIQKALEKCGGNKSETARMLGYKNYQTLAHEMKRSGIGS